MHPVLRAAREGNLEELKKLISEDSKGLQLTGIDNQRLIHIAAITGQLHVVRYLVEETKEDPNVVDDAGMTVSRSEREREQPQDRFSSYIHLQGCANTNLLQTFITSCQLM